MTSLACMPACERLFLSDTRSVVHTQLAHTQASGSHGSLQYTPEFFYQQIWVRDVATECTRLHTQSQLQYAYSIMPTVLNLGAGWACSRWCPQREWVRKARNIKSFPADTSTLLGSFGPADYSSGWWPESYTSPIEGSLVQAKARSAKTGQPWRADPSEASLWWRIVPWLIVSSCS